MSTFERKRVSRGGWITRAMAEHADVRNMSDLAAMSLCYGIVALILAGLGVLFGWLA